MFQFNGYVLDVARGCLRADNREVELRPKSFEVLRCLVENAGRLVTKDELLTAVWPNVVVSDEALTQCISEVREAIGDRSQSMIKTMPRRGYRFTAPISTPGDDSEARRHGTPAALSDSEASTGLADKPSLAVLPFVNLNNDPQQDYFSDGITGDIITELSRFSDLAVIARSSAFQYKGKAVDVRQVGRELGVRYVLEGSVRRDENRIRITAQLVDAVTGAHRWAERYDRDLRDAFAVQDEVVRTIVTILQARVVEAEAERTLSKPPATWEAYDYYLRGFGAWAMGFAQRPIASLYEARRCLERSIEIDPAYARAYVVLGRTYTYTYVEPRDEAYLDPTALERADGLARSAVQLDANLPQAHTFLGAVLSFKRRHEEAVAECEQAFSLNPNFSDHGFGLCLIFAGQSARAIEVMQASMRLEPFRNATRLAYTGNALYMLGRYEEAETTYRKALEILDKALAGQHPDRAAALAGIGAAQMRLGRHAEAEEILKESLALRERLLRPNHPGLAEPLTRLAELYVRTGRAAEAEAVARRAVEIREHGLSSNHPHLAVLLSTLGDACRDQGKDIEAEALFQRSMAILEKTLGAAHPEFAKPLLGLGRLRQKQNAQADAEDLLKRAYELRKATLGDHHPETADAARHYAELLRAIGRAPEAATLSNG